MQVQLCFTNDQDKISSKIEISLWTSRQSTDILPNKRDVRTNAFCLMGILESLNEHHYLDTTVYLVENLHNSNEKNASSYMSYANIQWQFALPHKKEPKRQQILAVLDVLTSLFILYFKGETQTTINYIHAP